MSFLFKILNLSVQNEALRLQRLVLLCCFHGNPSPWRCGGNRSLPEPGETAAHPTGPNPSSDSHRFTLRDELIRDTVTLPSFNLKGNNKNTEIKKNRLHIDIGEDWDAVLRRVGGAKL